MWLESKFSWLSIKDCAIAESKDVISLFSWCWSLRDHYFGLMMRNCHSYCLWLISHSVPFPQRLQRSSLLTWSCILHSNHLFSSLWLSSVILDSLLIGGDKSSLSKYENKQIKPEHAVKMQNKKIRPERIE